jgi:hypothetical protein
MSQSIVLPKYIAEIVTPENFPKRGETSRLVRRLQEWLTLQGNITSCDGEWGPATSAALKKFKGAGKDDTLDAMTWASLIFPLVRATAMPRLPEHFGSTVCEVARQYLRERAREAGGDNMGPWQRHFSRGREGQPWCQDFASTCWFDAARALQMKTLPFALCDDNWVASSYVPWVANEARRAGKFQPGETDKEVPAGSMFFLRHNGSWSHVGLVTAWHGDSIETIEGNTNDDGSANGYEVAARHRARYTCDFGLI